MASRLTQGPMVSKAESTCGVAHGLGFCASHCGQGRNCSGPAPGYRDSPIQDHTHAGGPAGAYRARRRRTLPTALRMTRRTINETRFAIAGYRDPRPNLSSVSVTIGETIAWTGRNDFSLTADIANGGGAASVATTLVVYQSGDSELSDDDTEAGRVRLDAVDPSGTRAVSLDVTGPQTPGTYHYDCVRRKMPWPLSPATQSA